MKKKTVEIDALSAKFLNCYHEQKTDRTQGEMARTALTIGSAITDALSEETLCLMAEMVRRGDGEEALRTLNRRLRDADVHQNAQ